MSIGGEADGPYNSPKASRPKKSKDESSPTGFESSPKNNMYTKTMKFKIVDPKDRINSKDLWNPKKGQPKFDSFPQSKKVYTEIKINTPVYYIIDQGDKDTIYFKGSLNDLKDKFWNNLLKKSQPINQFQADGHGFQSTPGDGGYRIINADVWEKHIGKHFRALNPGVDIYQDLMNEVRYSKFKKETSRRTPQEQLHKAIKEIQMKMDEVNKLVDFTSKMKQELREDDGSVKYLKRTKTSIGRIQEKIQHINNKIKNILE